MILTGKCPKAFFSLHLSLPLPQFRFLRNLRVLLGAWLWEAFEEIAVLSLEARAEVKRGVHMCVLVENTVQTLTSKSLWRAEPELLRRIRYRTPC